MNPVRDRHGLVLTPDTVLASPPGLDVLLVPGGHGQEALMEDAEVLEFLRSRARSARYVFSVCTGALLCGAAGLLRGVRATTHWNSFHLLHHFGAIPVGARVVVDGRHVSAAGVSAPQPLSPGGTPQTSPPEIVAAGRATVREISERRLATAKRVAERLGIGATVSGGPGA